MLDHLKPRRCRRCGRLITVVVRFVADDQVQVLTPSADAHLRTHGFAGGEAVHA